MIVKISTDYGATLKQCDFASVGTDGSFVVAAGESVWVGQIGYPLTCGPEEGKTQIINAIEVMADSGIRIEKRTKEDIG